MNVDIIHFVSEHVVACLDSSLRPFLYKILISGDMKIGRNFLRDVVCDLGSPLAWRTHCS